MYLFTFIHLFFILWSIFLLKGWRPSLLSRPAQLTGPSHVYIYLLQRDTKHTKVLPYYCTHLQSHDLVTLEHIKKPDTDQRSLHVWFSSLIRKHNNAAFTGSSAHRVSTAVSLCLCHLCCFKWTWMLQRRHEEFNCLPDLLSGLL